MDNIARRVLQRQRGEMKGSLVDIQTGPRTTPRSTDQHDEARHAQQKVEGIPAMLLWPAIHPMFGAYGGGQ